jgi:hypothetical protein
MHVVSDCHPLLSTAGAAPAPCHVLSCMQIVWDALAWNKLSGLDFNRRASTPEQTLIGYPGIDTMELKALWALVAIESVLLVFFIVFSIVLLWLPWIGACRQKRVSAAEGHQV